MGSKARGEIESSRSKGVREKNKRGEEWEIEEILSFISERQDIRGGAYFNVILDRIFDQIDNV